MKIILIVVLVIVIIGVVFIIYNSMSREETRVTEPEFTEGPIIDNHVLTWLKEDSNGRIIRLPVSIKLDGLRTGEVHLTQNVGGASVDRIPISLDTSAMSVGLPMQLKPYCNADLCNVWLEGTWGSLVSTDSESERIFAVRRIVGKVEDSDDFRVYFREN